jgi:hypothetical protein
MKMTARFSHLFIGMLNACDLRDQACDIAAALKPAASCELLLPVCNQIDFSDSQSLIFDLLL